MVRGFPELSSEGFADLSAKCYVWMSLKSRKINTIWIKYCKVRKKFRFTRDYNIWFGFVTVFALKIMPNFDTMEMYMLILLIDMILSFPYGFICFNCLDLR